MEAILDYIFFFLRQVYECMRLMFKNRLTESGDTWRDKKVVRRLSNYQRDRCSTSQSEGGTGSLSANHQ